MALAAPEAWSTTGEFLRFLPFIVFIIFALGETEVWPRLIQAVAAIVVLWLLDDWVQIFTGYSVAGAMEKERVSGIFGAQHLKLGPVLAVLAPFVLLTARMLFGRRGLDRSRLCSCCCRFCWPAHAPHG